MIVGKILVLIESSLENFQSQEQLLIFRLKTYHAAMQLLASLKYWKEKWNRQVYF